MLPIFQNSHSKYNMEYLHTYFGPFLTLLILTVVDLFSAIATMLFLYILCCRLVLLNRFSRSIPRRCVSLCLLYLPINMFQVFRPKNSVECNNSIYIAFFSVSALFSIVLNCKQIADLFDLPLLF